MVRSGAFTFASLFWICATGIIDATLARPNAAFATGWRYHLANHQSSWDMTQNLGMGRQEKSDRRFLLDRYAQARNVRTQQGHDAAMPYYQQLLIDNPDDRTAGSRIAASPETPFRHDLACGGTFCVGNGDASDKGSHDRHDNLLYVAPKIQRLQEILRSHLYDYRHISDFFGISNVLLEQQDSRVTCAGPLFCSSVAPGSVTLSNYPFGSNDGQCPSALACLVGLFLLGLAVPKAWLVDTIGASSCDILRELGLLFPCSVDPSLYIPYVHIFPLDFVYGGTLPQTETTVSSTHHHITLWLVTDLHPRVLSTVSVGTSCGDNNDGNAVMYIGPDSMALAQHFAPYDYLQQQLITKESRPRALDLCTGSGIQALAAMVHWNMTATARTSGAMLEPLKVTAVDVNPRALRFTYFNAILNGLHDQLNLMEADLITGQCRETDIPVETFLRGQRQNLPLQLILANPPFLPVPFEREDNGEESPLPTPSAVLQYIQKRYGLFSAGGASGEVVLQRIVELAGRCLTTGGVLGVVSEFFLQESDADFSRIASWWTVTHADVRKEPMSVGRGLLFLNEFPVKVETYAERRGDTPQEKVLWRRHLQLLNISQASPGLLFVQKNIEDNRENIETPGLDLVVVRVPKTEGGSIWTPSNVRAINFTQSTTNLWLSL